MIELGDRFRRSLEEFKRILSDLRRVDSLESLRHCFWLIYDVVKDHLEPKVVFTIYTDDIAREIFAHELGDNNVSFYLRNGLKITYMAIPDAGRFRIDIARA
jgi:hypothetical protein